MKIRGKYLIAAVVCCLALLGGCDKPTVTKSPSSVPVVPDPPEPPEPQDITFTLMTYNVGTFNKYRDELGHFSYQEVAGIINAVGAKVVGLNETDHGALRTHVEFQESKLASTLGSTWDSHFFNAAYLWYGNAVIWDKATHWQGISFDRVVLEKTDGSEVRSMGAVEFYNFFFLTTHLDHVSETDRLSAIDKITAWAGEHNSGKPIFLAGDMNARPGSAPLTKLLEHWIQLTGNDYTFPSDNPDRCIDYIFLYKAGDSDEMPSNLELLETGVVTADAVPSVATASDHCPVWARLLLRR